MTHRSLQELGKALRDARIENGLTQSLLAQSAGTSQDKISKYESGKVAPSAATLSRLCSSLEIPFDQLIRIAF